MNNIKVIDQQVCCSCGLCEIICPNKSIKFSEDTKGFFYPVIDYNTCINCGNCLKKCPVTKSNFGSSHPQKAYAAWIKNSETVQNSSSGGVFSAYAEYILNNNGIVYGASWQDDFSVVHSSISDKRDLSKLYKSKYVQSDIHNVFTSIRKDVNEGKFTLFCGTPCQTAAIASFFGEIPENLYLIDIVCHGNPSPLILKKYVKELEDKYKAKLEELDFRNKNNTDWLNYNIIKKFSNGNKIVSSPSEDSYMKLFLNNYSLKQSCYNCSFKADQRESDITLADFWGIKETYPDYYNKNGTSLMLVNTKKGEELLKQIQSEIVFNPVEFSKLIQYNQYWNTSVKKPKNLQKFWAEINKSTVEELATKYTNLTVSKKVIKLIIRLIKN